MSLNMKNIAKDAKENLDDKEEKHIYENEKDEASSNKKGKVTLIRKLDYGATHLMLFWPKLTSMDKKDYHDDLEIMNLQFFMMI